MSSRKKKFIAKSCLCCLWSVSCLSFASLSLSKKAPLSKFKFQHLPNLEPLKGVQIDGGAPLRAPLDKLVPADDALTALVTAHAHAAPEVLRDTAVPAGLAYRAVDRVDTIPPLIGRDLGEVRRGECARRHRQAGRYERDR